MSRPWPGAAPGGDVADREAAGSVARGGCGSGSGSVEVSPNGKLLAAFPIPALQIRAEPAGTGSSHATSPNPAPSITGVAGQATRTRLTRQSS